MAATMIAGRCLTLAPEFRRWRHRLGPGASELLLDIIDLAEQTTDGLALARPLREIATATGTSKDTVRRVLRNLEAAGVLERVELGLGPLDPRMYLVHPEAVGITVAA